MRNIKIKEFETERLFIRKPTIEEQYTLWNILRDERVNRYYFPTPNRIFVKNNLDKCNIEDLKKARKIFMDQLNDWERQLPFYKKKIDLINAEDNSQKFTWSVFLKNGEVIGQMTVQPKDEYENNPAIRDVGWFIDPHYQGHGYASEMAKTLLDYMFNEVEIEQIITSAAIINEASWKLMEKLGFARTGESITNYYDDNDNILNAYCYKLTRKMYNGIK